MEDERPVRLRALDLARELAELAQARGRDDLAERARGIAERLADTAITVVVAGEFKQGKSSLVNALLGHDLCVVDDAVATAVPTFVRHAERPFVTAVFGSRVEPRSVDDVGALTVERDGERPTAVLAGVPAPVLEPGLVLVDTPGIGGLDSRTGAITLNAVGRADAVLFVSDASQELTAAELEFLQSARAQCPTIALVLTKADINPAWRKVVALDQEHVAGLEGDPLRIFPVASPLRDLGAESGIEDLLAYLAEDVVGRADAVATEAAVAQLLEVTNHLDAELVAEARSLEDGGATAAALEAAVARSERLHGAGSRWRVALEDGCTDIASDLEHELRTAIRRVLSDAEAAIDRADPAQTWGELEPWLNRRLMTEVLSCYRWLEQRLIGVASDIDALFRVEGEEAAPDLGLQLALAPGGVTKLDGQLRVESARLGKEAFTALRGVQGGMVLFGVVAQIAGLALTGPAVVVFGVAMGGRSLREERRKQLAQRKQRAKVPVRKWLDEVQVLVTKDTADRLRESQRTLRDHFDELARSLQRSTEEALQAARRAAEVAKKDRAGRRAELDAERARIERVRADLAATAAV
jgi:hypothetical protein